MPRSARVAEQAAARGFVYDKATRGVYVPGTQIRFSRRQWDKMRDQPPPFAIADDAGALARFVRQRRADGERLEALDAMGDRRLLAAIAILRRDALEPGERRSPADARRFAWALRRLHGIRRLEWTRYLTRH